MIRVISFILSILLFIFQPLTVLADIVPGANPSDGAVVVSPNTGGGVQNRVVTYPYFGYKVTMTTPQERHIEEIGVLGTEYTENDLEAQLARVGEACGTTYWEPGACGLNFYQNPGGTVRFQLHGYEAVVSEKVKGIVLKTQAPAKNLINPIAYMIWNTEGGVRQPGAPEYSEEMAKLFEPEIAATYGDGRTWLSAVATTYASTLGYVKSETLVTQLFGNGDSAGLVESIPNFSWSQQSPFAQLNSGLTPYQKVDFIQRGLVSMDVIFAMACDETGNTAACEEFINIIYNWITSGYDPTQMGILDVECTSCSNVVGGSQHDFLTLPCSVGIAYGTGAAEALLSKWDVRCTDRTTEAIVDAANGQTPNQLGKGMLMQGMGGYADLNAWWEFHVSNQRRNYYRRLVPYYTLKNTFGYFINISYFASTIGGRLPTGSLEGSFTWKK